MKGELTHTMEQGNKQQGACLSREIGLQQQLTLSPVLYFPELLLKELAGELHLNVKGWKMPGTISGGQMLANKFSCASALGSSHSSCWL